MSLLSMAPAPPEEDGEYVAPSFVATFRVHGPYVWRLLRRLGVSPDDADDLCQEVFVVVHRRWADIDKTRPIRPWIYGVAVRLASQHKRGRRRHDSTNLPHDLASPAAQHDAIEQRQARDLLQEAIAGLDEPKRAVFVLYELEELTMPEIAEAVGCPLQTAYSRLRAARQEVKAFFTRFGARREFLR